MDVYTYAKLLLDRDPEITPEEMMHNLHVANYSLRDCLSAVKRFFGLTAAETVSLAISEFKHPLPDKELLISDMESIGYNESEAEAAVEEYYPSDTCRYSISLNKNSLVTAPAASQYNLGVGDFTVEAWVSTTSGGTVISRKPYDGCAENGGFLLVVKSTGVVKLATDDGYGFYEVNTETISNLLDGAYHHVLGLRRGTELEIYIDFKKVNATVRTDRFAGLNINNRIRLAIGFTDQTQEEYNHFIGKIGEVRLWSIPKTYTDADEWKNTDYVSHGLIGMYSFDQKRGDDYSTTNNEVSFQNVSFEEWDF